MEAIAVRLQVQSKMRLNFQCSLVRRDCQLLQIKLEKQMLIVSSEWSTSQACKVDYNSIPIL